MLLCMVKHLHIIFEDKEYKILNKFKAKYDITWHDMLLALVKAENQLNLKRFKK